MACLFKKLSLSVLTLASLTALQAEELEMNGSEPNFRTRHLLIQLKNLETQVAQVEQKASQNSLKSEELYANIDKQIQELEKEISQTYAKTQKMDQMLAIEFKNIEKSIGGIKQKNALTAQQTQELQALLEKRIEGLEGNLGQIEEKEQQSSKSIQKMEHVEVQTAAKGDFSRARLDNMAVQLDEVNRRIAKLEESSVSRPRKRY